MTCYPFYFVGSARNATSSLLLWRKKASRDAPQAIASTTRLNNCKRRNNESFQQNAQFTDQAVSYVFVCVVIAVGAWAQDVSTTTVQHGPSSFETQVRNAEVVYVEGNDLVLKLETGRLEHMVVPDSDKFHIDGRELSVDGLKPGMKLTESIITTKLLVTSIQ